MSKIKVQKVQQLEGHRDAVYTLIPTKNNAEILSAGGDGLLALWKINESVDGKLIAKVAHSVYAIALDEVENRVFVGHNFEGIHVIDFNTNQEIASKKLIDTTIFDIKIIENQLIIAFGNGQVWVLDKNSLEILHQLNFSTQSARCLAISKKILAIGYSDATIRLVDLSTFTLCQELKGHTNSVFALSYSPNGKYLISTGRDATLKIWNVEQHYELQQSIPAHLYTINHLTYSPDGQYFATCSMDKSIKIWDATTFQLLKVIDKARHAGHGTSINKLHWTSHENQLISCSDDRTISVWKIEF